jgi:hypothetical protein
MTETPYFLTVNPYSGAVIHNAHVYKFLQVFLKNQILAHNLKVTPSVLQKMSDCGTNWLKFHISWLWGLYFGSIIHNGHICKFLWVLQFFQILAKKCKYVSLQFCRKMPDCGKNSLKLCISWPWSPYSRSVIHNGHLDKFLWILKNFNFSSKSKGVRLRFYQKMLDCSKNSSKLCISWLWRPYFGLVIYNGHIYIYLWVLNF